jgi:hypothetical protein
MLTSYGLDPLRCQHRTIGGSPLSCCPVSRDLVRVSLELDRSARVSHLIWPGAGVVSLNLVWRVALSHPIPYRRYDDMSDIACSAKRIFR